MLNYLWSGMLLIGIATGFITGRTAEVSRAILECSNNAVNLAISLLGIMCLWTGIMEIALRAEIIENISKLLSPITRFLFPNIPKKHPAQDSIVMNIVANFLGLGNAATPLGLKAMQEMQTINKRKHIANNDMCMFLIINTTSIQLIPATLIALRTAAGSHNPSGIIVVVWITSLATTITGVICGKIFSHMWG